jgi:hypothetical protein
MMINNSQNENYCKSANQVIKKLKFLLHIDKQIVDAHNQGNTQAEMTLRIVRAVQQRHTNLMKDFLVAEASAS